MLTSLTKTKLMTKQIQPNPRKLVILSNQTTHTINIISHTEWNKSPECQNTLRMNFSNYQNRRKLRKFWGIDLYTILKSSAKLKRNWFTSFEITPLLIFGCLTCILMGKYNMKNMLLKIQCILRYQSLWKFTYKRMIY